MDPRPGGRLGLADNRASPRFRKPLGQLAGRILNEVKLKLGPLGEL